MNTHLQQVRAVVVLQVDVTVQNIARVDGDGALPVGLAHVERGARRRQRLLHADVDRLELVESLS